MFGVDLLYENEVTYAMARSPLREQRLARLNYPFAASMFALVSLFVAAMRYGNNHVVLLPIAIFAWTTIAASVQDNHRHEVDRFLLRFTYLSSLVLVTYMILLENLPKKDVVGLLGILFSLFFVYLVMFFVLMGIGASDFRMLMCSLPLQVYLFRGTVAGIILFQFFIMTAYQFFKQRQMKKKEPVPLAFAIMAPNALLFPFWHWTSFASLVGGSC